MADKRRGAELLERVKLAAKLGGLKVTRHARIRMDERGATAEDVRQAILTSSVALEQPDEGTIRLEGGADTDGVGLKVVVADDPRGLRIVTVM
jgi:hypothetical protein